MRCEKEPMEPTKIDNSEKNSMMVEEAEKTDKAVTDGDPLLSSSSLSNTLSVGQNNDEPLLPGSVSVSQNSGNTMLSNSSLSSSLPSLPVSQNGSETLLPNSGLSSSLSVGGKSRSETTRIGRKGKRKFDSGQGTSATKKSKR